MNRVSLGNKVKTSQRGQGVKFLTAVDFVLLTLFCAGENCNPYLYLPYSYVPIL